MSHITRIKTKIKNKEFLICALKDLGLSYVEGEQEISGFGGRKQKVDLKIPLRLSGDIGLRMIDGCYEIVADWWRVRDLKQDTFLNQLSQRYAYHATIASLKEQGFGMVEEQKEGSKIRITLRRVN
jgi:hypothetical protein